MQLSFALVLTAVVATLGAEANVLQAGSCAMSCKGPKTGFCSGVGALPTALSATTYNNECECLQAKCLKGNAVQCYAKPTAGKCDPKALLKLNEPTAKSLKLVCGSNGVTYDNYFHLKVARELGGIQFLQTGKCTSQYKTCMTNVKCSNEDKVQY
ncbi:hypothetical protein SDRG_15091 [Saprolegnia diclina VS20]|uniref:Uncharacterized protein n=1 Tax=Saprolegnia diclina (strain VS20) TaxID=1156394 RepID=T0PXV6_SAPDV|nr:hypothetical protein SDRG_15091 [Saprolegnia diclina VS20]EQC27081.1 hypothetical protein SDRG_15091 [Saprolegnia diclina VS20]|eukprot:XP_008619475.1 hypothetical protein SDRG_15091 [Saprolegnia diclina VS20]